MLGLGGDWEKISSCFSFVREHFLSTASPWYDVIYRYIFTRLDLRDLCHLRRLSTEYRVLVDNYIATMDTLDVSSYRDFEPSSFEV